MKYWQFYRSIYGSTPHIAMKKWYIEHGDGYYTLISFSGHPEIKDVYIDKSKNKPQLVSTGREEWREVSKERVDRALKIALKALDLPKEINFLKHKL
jgi:hypothetical protein